MGLFSWLITPASPNYLQRCYRRAPVISSPLRITELQQWVDSGL